MLSRIICLSLIALAAGHTVASGQEVTMLPESQVKKLDDRAFPVYREGVLAYNHINFDAALSNFYQAMKLNPRHAKLRLLVGNFALDRGQMKFGDESLKLFNVAQEAFEGLVAMENLDAEDRRQAATRLESVRRQIATLPQRDYLREGTGTQLIQEIAEEREAFKTQGLTPLGWRAPGEITEPEEDEEDGDGARGAGGARGGR